TDDAEGKSRTTKAARSASVQRSARAASQAAISDLLKTRLFELRKRGFNRLYQNAQVFEFSTPESLLDVNFAEPVSVLVDRLTVSPEARARIVDAVEIGYRQAGEVIFEIVPGDNQPA